MRDCRARLELYPGVTQDAPRDAEIRSPLNSKAHPGQFKADFCEV